MTCQKLRREIHEFLDGELPAADRTAFRSHLETCSECRHLCQELDWVKSVLGPPEPLSPLMERRIWRGVHARIERDFSARLVEYWDRFRTFFRDLDQQIVWSKLSAVPVTVIFFVSILGQFSPPDFQQWNYPVVANLSLMDDVAVRPVVTRVPVRHRSTEINDLMSAVWKIPFEDSLSLVAEIQPEGHAEVEDVLHYPKSESLLRAVSSSLRNSHFQVAGDLHSFVIYSFQKVDVYGDQGL